MLPFAVAAARTEGDAAMEARAQEVFATLPGLPSNAITRTMRGRLALARLPGRARAHQGLHHLWAAHCREKRCSRCPCALAGAAQPPPTSHLTHLARSPAPGPRFPLSSGLRSMTAHDAVGTWPWMYQSVLGCVNWPVSWLYRFTLYLGSNGWNVQSSSLASL